jgi:phycobilisome core component
MSQKNNKLLDKQESWAGMSPEVQPCEIINKAKLKNAFIAVGRNLIMRDAVTSLIRKYDVTGRYLDRDAIENLKQYFASGTARLASAALINANSAAAGAWGGDSSI